MSDSGTTETYQETLATHRKTLRMLLLQLALFSPDQAPPHILHGIEHARTEIRHLKELLRASDVLVQDLPNDEPSSNSEELDNFVALRDVRVNEAQTVNIYHSPEKELPAASTALQTQGNTAIIPHEYLEMLESIRSDIIASMREDISYLKENNDRLISITEKLQDEVHRLREVIYPASTIENEDDLKEEIKHLTLLRKEFVRRLRALELDQARKGSATPAETEIEIDDIRVRIAEIDARIKILSYDIQKLKSN